MRFGFNLVNNGPGATPEALIERGRFAEDVGFHIVMVSDHVALTPDVAQLYPTPFYDPFVVLAHLAGTTTQVELGTTILVIPYRHPLLTARMAASIDQFSSGRLIIGAGVGWAEQEYAALGIDYTRRGAITDEYLAVIKAAWTSGQVSHLGQSVRAQDVHTAPLPARRPRIPLWIGGQTPRALRRVMTFGDCWHPLHLSVADIRAGRNRLRALAAELERPTPATAPRLRLQVADIDLPEDGRVAGTGSIDQIRRDLHDLADLGAEAVIFDTYDADAVATALGDDLRALERLANDVLDLEEGVPR